MREALIEVVKQHRPTNFASLKKSLDEENINTDDEKLLALIEQLKSEGRIKLSIKGPGSFKEYLADIWNTWWFYLAIIVALSELFFVISNAQAGAAMFL